MSRSGKIVRNSLIVAVAVFLIAVVAALVVVRTAWFRNYVREKIIATMEESTGGRVEIGSFDFDAAHLRATIGDFVIHGKEPAGSPPFLRVSRVMADLRLFTRLTRPVDISYLRIDRPEANVVILADGQTNIPSPQKKTASNKSPLQTVVDLAVGRFEVNDGALTLDSRKQTLNLRGSNLRAQLSYSLLSQTYTGQISLQPVYVVSGRNTPVSFRIKVPVIVGSDRIDVHQASISTPASNVSIDGSFENIKAPRVTVRVTGSLAVADLKNVGDLPLAVNGRGVPSRIDLAANVTASTHSIDISGLNVKLGRSSVEASGTLEDPHGSGKLAVRSTLDMGEIARLVNAGVRPNGAMVVNGDVRLGTDRRNLTLTSLTLMAFGGRFLGTASLQDFEKYQVEGELSSFDTGTILSALGEKLPYDGVISGYVTADGDANNEKNLAAQARLSVTQGKRGIPVSGRLNVDYKGASDNLMIGKSYLVLPHSRLDVDGSLDKALNVSLKSSDLHDFVASNSLALNHSEATFAGTVTGALKAPKISGHMAANRLVVEGRQFDSVAADVAASRSGAAIRNGALARAAMQAHFSGSVGLSKWNMLPREPVTADVAIDRGDLADVMVLTGQNSAGYSGALSAAAHVMGTVGNPIGTASVQAADGTIAGQPYDQARVQVSMTDQLVTIPAAFIQAGAGRVDMSGEFRHPKDNFTTGQLRARMKSNDVTLATIRQTASGTVQINLDVAGSLTASEFLLTNVNADVSTRALRVNGQSYGDLKATARTNGPTAAWNLASDFAGSTVRLNGNTQLVRDYPTIADANIANLPIDKVLAAAKRTDVPVRGNLAGSVHLAGTVSDPRADANLDLTRAVVYDEPIDQVRVRAAYLPSSIDISQLQVEAGPSRIEMTAHYDHAARNLLAGTARFNVESSRIDLARIHNIQTLRPGLGGTLQITARGDGTIGESEPRISLRDLNLNLAATGIAAQGKNFGDLKLTADSVAGNKVQFALDSSLADASIHGRGTAALTAGYPVDAQVSFNNVLYTHFANLLGRINAARGSAEAAVDGQVTLNGPVMDSNQLRANLQLTRLNITAKPLTGQSKPIAVTNQGPVTAMLDHGNIQIQNAHLSGAQTDIQAAGSASLSAQTLALTLNAKVGLEILPNFDPDLYSSGSVDVTAAVRGTTSQPLLNGQLTLQNASFNYAGFPAGISNANGVVAFNGNTATIRNLAADAGGGKLTVTGFAGYANGARFGVRVKASRVRARLQQGVSVTANADLQLTGTSRSSVVSGSAVIDQVTYNPRTDIASILSRTAPAVQSASSQSTLLDNMRLDIRVRTSSGLSVQADIAESLSASADLRVQGTASQPGVLGKITINEGQLVFFGATYTIDTGTIAFFNPLQMEPILDLSLETQAQGVDVTVRVTGPIDNMKLSYTSNPPLQFQEIVSLLAAGKTPTSDPTLLANQPQQPQSSFQQMGESAVLGEAVANPVAGRLQRVFGVSQLKVDPTFQAGSNTPTARLTLQQRITSNLTFTYTSALDDPNGEIIQVQWAFDPKWSAVATRDQNGIFSINFLYKRQFR